MLVAGTEVISWEEDRLWNSAELVSQLEKAMSPHSSILAWKIPWEEPGRLQSTGSLRVGVTPAAVDLAGFSKARG